MGVREGSYLTENFLFLPWLRFFSTSSQRYARLCLVGVVPPRHSAGGQGVPA